MTKAKKNLIYSCSGCSSAAQMANWVALQLDRKGAAQMACVAGVGSGMDSFLREAQKADALIGIDGCSKACARKCLEKEGLRCSVHFDLSSFGVAKRLHSDFDTDEANRIMEKVEKTLAESSFNLEPETAIKRTGEVALPPRRTRVLITGITGMVGSHLAEYILDNHPEVEIHGIARWRSPLDNIRSILPKIRLHFAELRDLNSIVALMREVEPHKIFHLAAQSYVTTSYSLPADTLHTNVIGTANLLDAIRIADIDPLVHICSSSEVYGQVRTEELPISETNPFRPASPYAVSKVGEDMLGLQYYLSYGIKIIRTRMFTHTGPRRGDVFAESAFAKQIAEIEAGLRVGPMSVGNLNSVRTFADVRDVVRAYWLLLEKCLPGEVYNIGGDRTMTVGEMLEMLKSMAKCEINHRIDSRLLRPSDVTLQIPNTDKFKKATGWSPSIPIEKTLSDLLDYHRQKIREFTGGDAIKCHEMEAHESQVKQEA